MRQVALKCTASFIRQVTANLKKHARKSMNMKFAKTIMIVVKKIALKDIPRHAQTSAEMVNVSTRKGVPTSILFMLMIKSR